MITKTERENLINWMRNGTVGMTEDSANNLIDWMVEDDCTDRIAVDMMNSGRVFDQTARIVLHMCLETT